MLPQEQGAQLSAVPHLTPAPSTERRVDNPALVERIFEVLKKERLYSRPGLTIGELAERLSLQEYRLRRVINKQLGYRNFNQFLNAFRIEEACNRLALPFEQREPIANIAFDVGYSALSSFNKAFKPNRTTFDWLSRDPVEVDSYIADPLCGFRCTNQLWIDLLGGLEGISNIKQLSQIDPGLPLLVIGGDCDPVSAGKRLNDLAGALKVAGLKNVELKIYPGARHELLNETNRDEVTRYLINWLDKALVFRRMQKPDRKEKP
mgnify:CR=1 FL=1